MAIELYLKEERFCRLVKEGWTWEDAAEKVGMLLEATREGPRAPLYLARLAELGWKPEAAPEDAPLEHIDARDVDATWVEQRLIEQFQKADRRGENKTAAEVLKILAQTKGIMVQKREVTFPKIGDMSPRQLKDALAGTSDAEWEEIRKITGTNLKPTDGQ